jgi:hypothetical protein
MPYTLPFLKVNLEGVLGATAAANTEQWSAGFHIIKNGGMSATPTEITAFLTAILPAFSSFHTNTGNAWGTNVWLTGASGALIGVDGRYANGSLQPTTRVALGTPVSGFGTPNMPWATALVFTLRSLVLRGPGSHGRFYWPMTFSQIASGTGVASAGTVGAWATSAQTLINAVHSQANTSFGSGTYVGLVSPKGAGIQSPVAQVWVGGKPDHMESREHRLSEAYVARSLSYTSLLIAERDRKLRDLLDEQDDERQDDDA